MGAMVSVRSMLGVLPSCACEHVLEQQAVAREKQAATRSTCKRRGGRHGREERRDGLVDTIPIAPNCMFTEMFTASHCSRPDRTCRF